MSIVNDIQPELGGDLLRVHRAISRALHVARAHAEGWLTTERLETGTKEGYLTYVRCLVTLMHGHHVTEDQAMFPLLQPTLPDAPYETLMAQHNAMVPILDELKGPLKRADADLFTDDLDTLVSALTPLGTLWQTHIALEEAGFGPDALAKAMSMEERRRLGKRVASNAAFHQRPFWLMAPFLLYNMAPADRAVMTKAIPGVALWVMRTFQGVWNKMTPFLLADL
jgi:hypothetical protein